MLSIQVHPHEDELRAARRRAMERSIAWLVADCCWRVPYRSIQRNDLWWSLRVAAVNLRRIVALASYSWGRDLSV